MGTSHLRKNSGLNFRNFQWQLNRNAFCGISEKVDNLSRYINRNFSIFFTGNFRSFLTSSRHFPNFRFNWSLFGNSTVDHFRYIKIQREAWRTQAKEMKKHGHSISFVVSSKPHYQAEFQYVENILLALSLFLEISVPFAPVSKFVKKNSF